MGTKTFCDVCDEEMNRTYSPTFNSPRKGRGSAVKKLSLRARLALWLLGESRLKRWTNSTKSDPSIWDEQDVCSGCWHEFERFVNEGDDDD